MRKEEQWQAILLNDKSKDGLFFYGVRTTGVYCRPSCPSKPPRPENTLFFDTAREAEALGFRPCKRCRPDLIAYDPQAEVAAQAKAAIEQSYAERDVLQERLNGLGVTRRHLTELFERAYGLSPEQYLLERRLLRAKELLGQGIPVTEVAFSVGLESAASFTRFFKKETGLSPSEYAVREAESAPSRLVETPLGPVLIRENESGLTSLRFDETPKVVGSQSDGRCLIDAERQLLEYFERRRRSFDLPLAPKGTDFQQRVWRALCEIPYGETRSYQDIAAAVGNPKASRAVGMANNRNPLMILIPCHRVVGKDGALVGYAGGIERKKKLLAIEALI